MQPVGYRRPRYAIQATTRYTGADREDLDLIANAQGITHSEAQRRGIRYLAAAIRKAELASTPAPAHPHIIQEAAS